MRNPCPPVSPQTPFVPPAGAVVREMRAGHAGLRVHHVGQLRRGHRELRAPAGAGEQTLLQRRSRAGQLGEQRGSFLPSFLLPHSALHLAVILNRGKDDADHGHLEV